MKQLNLPKESIDALFQHASMFIVPIIIETNNIRFDCFSDEYDDCATPIFYDNDNDEYIEIDSQYQIGDEVYFDEYRATIKDVKVVRVQDLTTLQIVNITNTPFVFFEDWYNKQYGNYEDNPYVFLYEVEECK